jgi:hypothetical protein
MKHKLLILAGVLAVVAVLGGFYGKPVAAEIRGLLVQDVDQPARANFQWTFSFTADTPDQTVTIPNGYRLVIDYVNVNGDAVGNGGGIQPEIVLYTPASNLLPQYYLYLQQSATDSTQFSGSWPVTIYADTLKVGTGYAGYPPEAGNFGLRATISGHLVFVGKSH